MKTTRVEEQFLELLQTRHNGQNAKVGQLLVAEPFLQGHHFHRSVIYLVEHGENGSVGFVLNKQLHENVGKIVPELQGIKNPLFMGGPLEPSRLYTLHDIPGIEGAVAVKKDLFWGGNIEAIAAALRDKSRSLLYATFFAGYCGWGANQLFEEIKEGTWLIGKIQPYELHHRDNTKLWTQSITALGGKYRLWATFPEDPFLT
jgi:putative transcriptional regulator